MGKDYRPCVVAVVTRDFRNYLVGERRNVLGSWQFPQGGIEPGEDPVTAVLRELGEEVGTSEALIHRQTTDWISYDFPNDLDHPITKDFRGQKQLWFLLKLQESAKPDLALSDGEFRSLDWRPLDRIIEGIVEWKRQSYQQGLRSLGLEV